MIIRDIADSSHVRILNHPLLCERLHPDKVAGAQEPECVSLMAAGSFS
jgi:hypothetical protein